MVSIRPLTQADINYVAESVKREEWGHLRRDIERCWKYEPSGCFIAEAQNKPTGHVFSVRLGKTGWVALLIVNPKMRGKGAGTVLMQTVIDYLHKAGAETIRLEAVEKTVPLYKRLGFREEFDSLRFRRQRKPKEKPKPREENIFPMQREDIKNTAKFDAQSFGTNRLRVLQSLYEDEPQQCFVAKEKQKTWGYIMSRKIQDAHWIGPWVSKNPKTAEKLLSACLDAIRGEETELRLGMPVLNKEGTRLMEKFEFQLVGKSIRMVWGKHKHKGDIHGVYGIAGPEKG